MSPRLRRTQGADAPCSPSNYDRAWLLTWTTYGTWLPGDKRGFVSPVRDEHGKQTIHNRPDTSYEHNLPQLESFAREAMKGSAIRLTQAQAQTVLEQIQKTAEHRNWALLAVAVMATHVHAVVLVLHDPDPLTLLRDFKSYASRALNSQCQRPQCGTWWTESGSRRKLPDSEAIEAAIEYVKRQEFPLVIWTHR